VATAEVTGTLRVLLVDDDDQLTDMYRIYLIAHGYSVITARCGEDALALALEESPDVIFLDLGLPGIGGLEVLERLRAHAATAAIPVVVLSNYSEPQLVAQSLRLGAREFLVKAHTTPADLTATTLRLISEELPA